MIKFVATELGIKKAFNVKEKNKTMRELWKLQLKQAQNAEEDDFLESIKQAVSLLDQTEEFITNVLGLTDAQAEKLEEIGQEELGTLSNRLSLALMHIDPDELAQGDEDEDEDPKSETESA